MDLSILAVGAADFFTNNLNWVIAAVVVVVGLLLGLGDLARLSPSRVWALSGLGFRESIRRRVLWITPLAIIGVIGVVQFQKAGDAQDAIRQTTKVCLFATGIVVVVSTLILACTSLPKEIESRVIYTVVTKPTTRLEIVLGKLVGFARVSGTILLIMGVFTFGYLKLREAWMVSAIRQQLNDPAVDAAAKPSLQYYSDAGLLGTKSMEVPRAMQVLAAVPEADPNAPRKLAGAHSQYFAVMFDLSDDDANAIVDGVSKGGGLFVVNNIGFAVREPTPEEARQIADTQSPTDDAPPSAVEGPAFPTTAPREKRAAKPVPQVNVQLIDVNRVRLVEASLVGGGKNVELPKDGAQSPKPAAAFLAPKAIEQVVDARRFYVIVTFVTPAVDYFVGTRPTSLVLTDPAGQPVKTFGPAPRTAGGETAGIWAQAVPGVDPTAPIFLSNHGRYGLQVLGNPEGKGSVALFQFADATDPQADDDGMSTLELRMGVEGSSMDYSVEQNSVIQMALQVRNTKTGQLSDPITISPENDRAAYVRVPHALVSGGAFDVIVRGLTNTQWFGLSPDSVKLVTADRSFAFNLTKSLFTLWLMAILVVSIGVFCSTFLSWPIAVVLTLVILLGHWGVMQVKDAAGTGLGAEVTQSLDLSDPTGARIVRSSVNVLTKTLNVAGAFLPDISKFSVTEDIERGISIPPAKIGQGAAVLLGYGLPMTVLAYVFLKRKEVAP